MIVVDGVTQLIYWWLGGVIDCYYCDISSIDWPSIVGRRDDDGDPNWWRQVLNRCDSMTLIDDDLIVVMTQVLCGIDDVVNLLSPIVRWPIVVCVTVELMTVIGTGDNITTIDDYCVWRVWHCVTTLLLCVVVLVINPVANDRYC